MAGIIFHFLAAVFLALHQPPQQAAANAGVFFLARADSSGDGLIDLNDHSRLYFSSYTGQTIPVSPEDISVVQYAVHPGQEMVAVSWQEDEQPVVAVLQIADQVTLSQVEIADLTNLRLNLNDSGLWIVGDNADGLPVIRGFDPATGDIISERVMRRPNTQLEVHHSGKWILGYNLEAGVLSVLNVPSLEGVPFEVSGYAAGRPSWSPVGETILIASRDLNNPDDLGVLVVDFTTLQTTRYDLPDYPIANRVDLQWSRNGQFIQVHAELNPGDDSGLPALAFLNLASGELQPVTSEADSLIWEWTSDDRAAIISKGIQVSEGQQPGLTFELYDPLQNTLQAIPGISSFQMFNVRWKPDGQSLAALAQSKQTGFYGLYIFDLGTAEPIVYFETTSAGLSQGRLNWSPDGTKIVFFIPADDLVFTSLGLTWAGFVLDLETRAVIRISPENSVVDILQIHVN